MLIGTAMTPCPHVVYPALRTVAVAAVIVIAYTGITVSGIAVAGGLVGMLPVLGEGCCKCHHYNGNH
jgi:hypothetical protein